MKIEDALNVESLTKPDFHKLNVQAGRNDRLLHAVRSGALTWTVEPPKRRGEWWWEPPDNRDARVVFIHLYEGYWTARGRTMSANEMSRPCVFLGGRWAGPLVKPVEPPDEETPPIGKLIEHGGPSAPAGTGEVNPL